MVRAKKVSHEMTVEDGTLKTERFPIITRKQQVFELLDNIQRPYQ